jgi:hypothetical protein
MAHISTIDQLNHLVHINKNAEAGFRTVAGNVKNSEIETLLAEPKAEPGQQSSLSERNFRE